jgi:F0F1-type ATP synthase assembly protein I
VKKAAAGRSKTTTTADGDIEQYMDAINSRRLFLGATLNMSWRLALTVLIPTIGGVWLDRKFGTAPSFTLTGFFLAIAGGCAAVWSTVKEVNELQAEEDNKKKPRGKKN